MRDELAFSRTLSPKQRRVVHLVAQKLGVYHYSVGEGEERYAVVTRIDPERVSHPMQAEPRRVSILFFSIFHLSGPLMKYLSRSPSRPPFFFFIMHNFSNETRS